MAPRLKNPDKMNFFIRDFPAGLYYKCQERRAQLQIPTLREFVIQVLTESLTKQTKSKKRAKTSPASRVSDGPED
jgi:hypothetical protein